MIIKGNARCDAAFWAQHLMRTDHNESVSIADIRGLSGRNVKECLAELDAIAEGSRTKNGFYVASLNPRNDEFLTPEQWEKAADIFERKMGLEGQPRIIVEHEKDGRTHRHGVWGRIDADTMKAIPAAFNYQKHEQAAREIELELGLERLESVLVKDRGTDRPERRPKDWEGFRAADTGIDPQAMRAEISALWQSADSGLSFKAALEDAGYILAKGDRRDFCIIDAAADEHSLAKRSGVRAADVRERMRDVDKSALPTVAEARQMARDAMDEDAAAEIGMGARAAYAPIADPFTDELARQLGRVPELTPDIAHGLAARFGDVAAEPVPEPERPEPVPEPTLQPGEVRRISAWGDAMRDVAGSARAFWHAVQELWADETSNRPEAERGTWAQLIDTGRKLWGGFRRHDTQSFNEGIEDAGRLIDEGESWVERTRGADSQAQPPQESGPKSWGERLRDMPRTLGDLMRDKRGEGVNPFDTLEEAFRQHFSEDDEPEEPDIYEPDAPGPEASPEPDDGPDIEP